MKKLTYLLALPIVAGMVWIFGVDIVYADANGNNQEIEQTVPQDTLRLVGHRILGKNPKVTIDGKEYESDILTRISPRCIRSSSISGASINIETKNNEIEYATETDRENVRTAIAAEESDKFYIRYTLKHENGDPYDVAMIRSKDGKASVNIRHGAKVLILVNGEKYSEEKASELILTDEVVKNLPLRGAIGGGPTLDEFRSEHGNDYEAALYATVKEESN